MNTTSMAGSILVARSISSASAIDAASERCGPNDSTAQRMIFDAGACSNSAFSSASSPSENGTACTWVTSIDNDTLFSCSDGALGFAEHLLVGTRLAVVDVEVLVRL